jgi:hypothetical protein
MRWKSKEYDIWHSHFALKPVLIKGEWVWLERVIRRGQRRNMAGKTFWEWTYVNSEFDLIKMKDSESAMQEGTVMSQANYAQAKSLVKLQIPQPSREL